MREEPLSPVWALGELLAEGEEAAIGALEDAALALLSGERADHLLGPHLSGLLDLPLVGHPWAQLCVAVAVFDVAGRNDPRSRPLVLAAAREFRQRGDDVGQGYTAYVRGNMALGRGQLQEAARWWEMARKYLGEDTPAQHQSLANLALGAYQQGDLRGAAALAEEALAVARIQRSRRAEGLALVYLAFVCLYTGEFKRAESALSIAEDAYLEISESNERVELPIVAGARGVLWSLRGDPTLAAASFDRGVDLASTMDVPWFEAVVRSARAEFTAAVDPTRAEADARSAYETLKTLGDEWFSTWALRAHAVAAREAGNLKTSSEILKRLLKQPLGPVERGHALLRFGETLLKAGDAVDAIGTLEEAASLFEAQGASYWFAWALMCLASAEPDRMADAHENVRRLVKDEAARAHLFSSYGLLEIRLLGSPSITVGGVALRFQTKRAELLMYALALAPRGLHWEVLAERLWPEAHSTQVAARLRTALWEARKALGSESWRLQRNGEVVRLDLEGVPVDLEEVRRKARLVLSLDPSSREANLMGEESLAQLRLPVLAGSAYEAWVEEEARQNAALAARIEGRVPGAGSPDR